MLYNNVLYIIHMLLNIVIKYIRENKAIIIFNTSYDHITCELQNPWSWRFTLSWVVDED